MPTGEWSRLFGPLTAWLGMHSLQSCALPACPLAASCLAPSFLSPLLLPRSPRTQGPTTANRHCSRRRWQRQQQWGRRRGNGFRYNGRRFGFRHRLGDGFRLGNGGRCFWRGLRRIGTMRQQQHCCGCHAHACLSSQPTHGYHPSQRLVHSTSICHAGHGVKREASSRQKFQQ